MKNFSDIYDVGTIQFNLVNHMEDKLDLTLDDPSSPFMLTLEAIADATQQGVATTATLVRQTYPTLCSKQDELLRHVGTKDLTGLFANPSSTTISLYVNALDVLSAGEVSRVGSDGKYISIGSGSSVTVDGVQFSIMNTLRVHYDGSTSVVEQYSEESGFNRIGSISSVIMTDTGGIKWIKFEVPVKQFLSEVSRIDLVGNFRYDVPYVDQFWYMTIKGVYDTELVDLDITFSDILYSPSTLTIKVIPNDQFVSLEIPAVYKSDTILPTMLIVEIFSTKGNMALPLANYISNDFVFTRDSEDVNLKNVTIRANSGSVVSGGKDIKTLEEMRSNVINNTLGELVTPITMDQLQEKTDRDGYTIKLYVDLITNRTFTISKNIDNGVFTSVRSEPDIYNNIAIISSTIDTESAYRVNDALVIPYDTLFEDVNGVMHISTDENLKDRFKGLGGYSFPMLSNRLGANRIMYTPYVNIIYDDYESKTVDIRNPVITDLSIVNRNYFISHIVNIDEIHVGFSGSTFKITMSLTDISSLNLNVYQVRGQISLENTNGVKLYFDSEGVPTEEDPTLTFSIPTNSYFNKDDEINITGGNSLLFNTVANISEMTIILFTDTPLLAQVGIYDASSEVALPDGVSEITALVKETASIQFGHILENLFNEVSYRFTPRKYKTYDVAQPYFHETDVLFGEIDGDWFADDAFAVAYKVNDAKTIPVSKNEILAGNLGDIIYRYNVGDTILDENGNPIIDTIQGVELLCNLLMFETEFRYFDTLENNQTYALLDAYVKEFVNYCDVFSEERLESTEYKYLPIQTVGTVEVSAIGRTFSLPQKVIPSITLYFDVNVVPNHDAFEIGKIIERHIEAEVIRLDNLRSDIASLLGITVVSIENLGLGHLFEVMVVNRNRFALDRVLQMDGSVEYNMNISVVSI